jgi:hypothetical protein
MPSGIPIDEALAESILLPLGRQQHPDFGEGSLLYGLCQTL